MADIYSILQAGYTNAGLNASQQTGQYVNVDPTQYEGSWKGTFNNNQSFTVSISNVSGFRAKVKYQSGSTVQYQDVLIKNNSFRIGNTKFTLQSNGAAEVKTVITDPVSGANTLYTGYAQQS